MKRRSLFFSSFSFFCFFLCISASEKKTPIVRWGQNSSTLTLLILIPQIKTEKVEFSEKSIHVSATSNNGDNFELNLNTLRPINSKKSSYEVLMSGLKLKIYKEVTEPCWKYLTKNKTNNKFIRDKSMGDANDCEEAKELWFSKYKHYIRLSKNKDTTDTIKKGDSLTNIITKLQKSYPSFYLHEF